MQLTARTCNYERMNVERLLARVFVAAGGVFWVVAQFGGLYFFEDSGITAAVGSALVPLAIAVGAFVLGWFYERIAAVALAIGAAAVVVWGLVAGWEMGSWLGMTAIVIGPMLAAAVLFWLASRMQEVCSLDETRPAG